MEGSLNLTGHILAMPPQATDSVFARSVIVVAQHNAKGAWGLVVNKPNPRITLDIVMLSAGIDYDNPETVYTGGPVENNRVHIIHSLDWRGLSTISVAPDMGITSDVSVLAAISRGEGPKLYRTCIGIAAWAAGQLDGEFKGFPPWKQKNSWIDAPATIDAVFNLRADEQWEQAIDIIATSKVASWL